MKTERSKKLQKSFDFRPQNSLLLRRRGRSFVLATSFFNPL
jgi:hypothetical protein